jgi:hypothetical protein
MTCPVPGSMRSTTVELGEVGACAPRSALTREYDGRNAISRCICPSVAVTRSLVRIQNETTRNLSCNSYLPPRPEQDAGACARRERNRLSLSRAEKLVPTCARSQTSACSRAAPCTSPDTSTGTSIWSLRRLRPTLPPLTQQPPPCRPPSSGRPASSALANRGAGVDASARAARRARDS